MPRIIGSHTIDKGGIDKAALRAANAGLSAVQIFTAIPKYYGDKMSIRPERIKRFRAALEQANMQPTNVMVHAAYVLNVSTEDAEMWARASAGLAKEMERSTTLGAGSVCFHPGAARDGDREAAARRVAKAITAALTTVSGDTKLLVENTAGAGTTMGRTPEEIGTILSHIPPKLRSRTGYGLDTCHLFSAGYDISASEKALSGILDTFESITGEPPSFFHLNDSIGTLGSNRDRHALLGEGEIGSEPFRWLMRDKRTAKVPLILETPQQNTEIAEEDVSADPYDVRMRELLSGFE
ncbi:MAG: deoxyribonuclease IV [Gemmatimonadaceae bacterium]|nr:deoxyribonuclease IV [Gemmatimonadaceae bacterium]MDQ3520588.1 deoxyribonuclease IV [Gemmatimonadota bacterium]